MSETFCAFEQLRRLEHLDPLLSHRIAVWQQGGRDLLPPFVKVLLKLANRQVRPMRPLKPFRLTQAHWPVVTQAMDLLGITLNDLMDPVPLRRLEDVFYAITCIKPIRVGQPVDDALLPLTWQVFVEGYDLLEPEQQDFIKGLADANGVPLPAANATPDAPEVDEPAAVEPIWFGAPTPEALQRSEPAWMRSRRSRHPVPVSSGTQRHSRDQAWSRTRRSSHAGTDKQGVGDERGIGAWSAAMAVSTDALAGRSGTRPGPGYLAQRDALVNAALGRGPPVPASGVDRSLACGAVLCGHS